ncbi:MAG: hypothetical protein IKV79_01000 [Oscillospiraceae bacterium]|nr:hypothetical protein [Oscillospiraceae bacterium]
MNTKKFYISLAVFGLLCAVSAALPGTYSGIFALISAFPFSLIALGLRALSLSGNGGNILAIILYIIVCLLPGGVLLYLRRKALKKEDILIGVFTAMMFAAIYYMINPALLSRNYGSEFYPLLKSALGGCCWCIAVCWVVFKLVGKLRSADKSGVQRLFKICLGVLAFFFAALAFGGAAGEISGGWENLKAANTALSERELLPTLIFCSVKAIINALPYALDAIVAVKGMELISAMEADTYSSIAVEKAEAISVFSILSLKVTLLAVLIFNILQIIFIKKLLVVDVELVLPLLSIAFMLASVLLSRLVRENKELKDDNDMFI